MCTLTPGSFAEQLSKGGFNEQHDAIGKLTIALGARGQAANPRRVQVFMMNHLLWWQAVAGGEALVQGTAAG